MTRKPKQPRLLPKTALEPIRDGDALSIDALTTRYRCENTTETGIKLEAVTCIRCGAAMKPV